MYQTIECVWCAHWCSAYFNVPHCIDQFEFRSICVNKWVIRGRFSLSFDVLITFQNKKDAKYWINANIVPAAKCMQCSRDKSYRFNIINLIWLERECLFCICWADSFCISFFIDGEMKPQKSLRNVDDDDDWQRVYHLLFTEFTYNQLWSRALRIKFHIISCCLATISEIIALTRRLNWIWTSGNNLRWNRWANKKSSDRYVRSSCIRWKSIRIAWTAFDTLV